MNARGLKEAMQTAHFSITSPDDGKHLRKSSLSHEVYKQPRFVEIRDKLPYKNASVVNLKPSLSLSFVTETAANYTGISCKRPDSIRPRPSAVTFENYGKSASNDLSHQPRVERIPAGSSVEAVSMHGPTNFANPIHIINGSQKPDNVISAPTSFGRCCARGQGTGGGNRSAGGACPVFVQPTCPTLRSLAAIRP